MSRKIAALNVKGKQFTEFSKTAWDDGSAAKIESFLHILVFTFTLKPTKVTRDPVVFTESSLYM